MKERMGLKWSEGTNVKERHEGMKLSEQSGF